MHSKEHYIIEEDGNGKFTVRAKDSDVASLIFDTEAEAILHATAFGQDKQCTTNRIVSLRKVNEEK